MKKSTIILFMFLAVIQSFSQIIPSEQRIEWHPGIPGGIPKIDYPVKNILDFGADPKGINDSYFALKSAIDALPSTGGVVEIPEGNFRIGSKTTIGKDNVIIRGMGMRSRLLMDFDDNSFEIVTYKRGTWQSSPGGFKKGSTKVKVTNSSLFKVGQFAEIEQDNDSLAMYTKPDWIQSWGVNAVGQMFEVTGISGDSISFRYPVSFDFKGTLNARIRPQGLVRNVGFENFYIEKLKASGHTFYFINSAYCWIRNVESNHTRKSHVNITSSLGLEIRDCYFHHSFGYGDGGSGYGVECASHTTNSLVENNIFKMLRHAMMVHLGANGNVFGYNYSILPVQGEGETNLNVGWTPPDISIHGHFPFMNLFESNRIEELAIADYWGPAGPGNTYFRNMIAGEGIFYYDQSRQQNLVGNTTTSLKDDSGKNRGNLEHGNKVKGVVIWDPNIPDHNLPNSYYLDSVPTFFTNLIWPVFGPDILGNNKLPAQLRYESIVNTGTGKFPDEANNTLIYPNPASYEIFIKSRGFGKRVQLIGLTGEVLFCSEIGLQQPEKINLSAYPPGVFLLRVFDAKGNIENHKVIKK